VVQSTQFIISQDVCGRLGTVDIVASGIVGEQ